MELINDIPRLYTGIAEWAGCLVVLLNCRRKVQTAPFIAISAAAVFIQCGFLMITADIGAGIVWILVMTAAFFLMCLYIFLCGGTTAKGAVYGAAAAFLHAEFAASLEWQLHFWLLKRIPVGTPFSVLLLATVYLIVFSLFYYLLKRHITEEYIRSLTWKEVTSISILMLFVFAFSNLSFSGRVQEDIFAIRTLADGFGIAVYWGFQINISELLTQKELYAMRHVLSSQYEQFRNYQESEEMLHMMQHDLKHQHFNETPCRCEQNTIHPFYLLKHRQTGADGGTVLAVCRRHDRRTVPTSASPLLFLSADLAIDSALPCFFEQPVHICPCHRLNMSHRVFAPQSVILPLTQPVVRQQMQLLYRQ